MGFKGQFKALTVSAAAAALMAASACSGPDTDTEPDPEPEQQAEITPVVGEGWELVWSDEFEGDEIDLTKWTHETNCWGGGNNEHQCYTDRPDNSFVRDGNLVIHAKEEEFSGPAEPLELGGDVSETTQPYTSARLRSAEGAAWTYGRIEISARVPGGQGIWPAIWMMPQEARYGGWAASGEIDIFEAVNLGTEPEPTTVHGTLHYGGEWPANTSSGTSYVPPTDPQEQFHTYAIEWAAGEIRWFVDDVHFATQTSAGWYSEPAWPRDPVLSDGEPFDQDFHLLLNVAVGGDWPGDPGEDTAFPVEMEVDYVRIWECAQTPETLEACATVSPDAQLVAGNQPPEPAPEIDYDPAFMDGDEVTIFDDEVQGPYYADFWAASGEVEISGAEDAERGTVTQFVYNANDSVAYFQSAEGFDFSDFRAIEFDLWVDEDPRADGGFMMKVDCIHPCGTGDVPIAQPQQGEWTSYSIELADLVAHEGSSLDVTNINTPLVVMPDIGNQEGVVLRVDNVRMVK